MGRKRSAWTEELIARLRELRDVDGLTWKDVGEAMGMTWSKCYSAYYHYSGARKATRAVRGKTAAPDMTPIGVDPEVGNRYRVARTTPADMAIPARQAPSNRARRVSLVDAYLLNRVATQGITAGVFGDPPPGRSALDKREPQP